MLNTDNKGQIGFYQYLTPILDEIASKSCAPLMSDQERRDRADQIQQCIKRYPEDFPKALNRLEIQKYLEKTKKSSIVSRGGHPAQIVGCGKPSELRRAAKSWLN